MIFTTFKQSLEDVYIAGRKINEINNLGLDTTNITEYTTALKGLTEKQAELVLSTKKFEVEQKQTILSNAVLSKTTGELTTAELEAILVTKNRNKNQAEALLINTGLITSETAEATATNVVTAAKLKELVQTKKLTKEEANLIAAKAGVTLANQKESTSLFAGISEKIKSVGTALKGLGTGLLTVAKAHPIIAAITTALTICGGAAIVNKIKQEKAAKAIKKAYKEAKQEIEEIENTFNEKSSKTKEIAKEYAELAQGVDLLTNSNNSLSTENYERFLELSNQLSELYPSLTKDFDDNGVAILDLSGNVDTIVSSLDDLIERQRILANQEIAGQAPDFFAGYVKDVDDLEEDVDKAKKKRDKIQNAYDVLSNWQGSKTFNGLGQQTKRGQDREYRYKNDYINALEALGIDWDYDWKKAILDNKWKVTTDYDNDFDSKIHEIYVSEFGKLNDEIDYAEEQLKQKKASVQRYLYSWLQSEPFYYQLEDAGLQKAIQEALFNFDWSTLPKDVQKDGELIAKYFEENILFAISNIDDPEISKALSDIYSGTLNSKELLDAISRVQDSFGDEHPISISLQPKVDDVEPLLNKVKSKFGEKYGNKLEELTLEELKIAADLEIDPKKTKEYIESELKSLGEGGSVNLTLRPKIDASELNKNGWDAGEGIATVFSSTFSNENGTVAVNFTPIIADPDTGKYLGVLSPEELQEYAEGVIAGAEDDLNLQIGSEFKGDNAIEQAETAAEKIHELQDRLYVSRDFSLSWDEFIAKINGGLTSFTIFSEAFNAKSFESTKEKLLELATSGELSADTISSGEEYKTLMNQTGLSAEQLVENPLDISGKEC